MGDAEVRRGLRAIVEAEHGFNQALERCGDVDGTFADAVGGAAVLLIGECDAKGGFELRPGAGELDEAGLKLLRGAFDGETELPGEALDGFDGGGICAELRAKLGPADAGLADLRRVDAERRR